MVKDLTTQEMNLKWMKSTFSEHLRIRENIMGKSRVCVHKKDSGDGIKDLYNEGVK